MRTNDALKVEALMESIADIGLQEPIDVLLVDGKFYGFSGCHRFEVCCSVLSVICCYKVLFHSFCHDVAGSAINLTYSTMII